MSRGLLLNPLLPIHYQAGCHLMLSDCSENPALHASKAAELYKKCLAEAVKEGREKEVREYGEFVWVAQCAVRDAVQKGAVEWGFGGMEGERENSECHFVCDVM
jgi:hypothetical protein